MKFRDVIATDPEVQERLTSDELDELFDPWQQLVHLDTMFERLGLVEVSAGAAV